MFKMVDGTGIIGVDMICPLGISTPQPPNYDRVELEGAGVLVLPNSLDAPLERLELGGKTEQVQTSGKNLFDTKTYRDMNGCEIINNNQISFIQNLAKITYEIKLDSGDYRISFKRKKYSSFTIRNGESVLHTNGGENDYGYNIKLSEPAVISVEFASGQNPNAEQRYVYDIQLEKGTTATPYEPYTGGKPSPSPEYPQEIKNSGKWNEEKQKYEVDVKVTGKNLFDIEKAKEKSNWTTSANGAGFVEIAVYVGTGSTVTVSNNTKINNPGLYYYGVALKSSEDIKYFICYPGYPNSKDTHTFTATEDYIYVRCNKTSLNDVIGVCGGLQIEIGASRTDFESYKEQSLTLTSDRHLTKWDRLVEQGGQIGWLYNSVNETIDGKTGKWSIQPASKIFYRTDITFPIAVPFCSELLGYDYSSVGYKKDTGISINNLGILCITLPEEVELTLDAYKQYLADNPLHVLYKDDSEEFVPLPQSEQNAIRALKTYYPTTVITADGGELDPDIKVTYRKEI